MVRVLLAVLLGAIVHFAWGAVSHMLLGWHDPTMARFKNEDEVMSVLSRNAATESVYEFPWNPGRGSGNEPSKNELQEWLDKHKRGPIGVVMFTPGGADPMSAQTYAVGFILDLVAATLAVFVLWVTLPSQQSFLKRVAIVMMMGLFAAVTTHLMYWNWAMYPMYYSVINAADTLVGWTAAGLVIAALMKPDRLPPRM